MVEVSMKHFKFYWSHSGARSLEQAKKPTVQVIKKGVHGGVSSKSDCLRNADSQISKK